MEQAFIDGAAVGGRRIKNLARPFKRIAQAFACQHHALRAGEPEVFTDALAFKHKKPAVNLRARGGGEQPATERQVFGGAAFGDPAELDPGITHAPVMAPDQQVPRHLLARVAIGLDAR